MVSLPKLFNKVLLYINSQIQILCFILVSTVRVLLEDMHGSLEEAMAEQPQPSSAVLPDELVLEIISRLPAKPLMRFRCVNKFFNSMISDPSFLQMHLKKSQRNRHFTVISVQFSENKPLFDAITFPISRLLENSCTTIYSDNYYRLNEYFLIGSYNGLICLFDRDRCNLPRLCFWNPATREKSEVLLARSDNRFLFTFGYDASNKTYKVVAFRVQYDDDLGKTSIVKVFSLGDNSWRDIQCFPVIPIYCGDGFRNNGVYCSGTINWLALCGDFDWEHNSSITFEQYVILSLDLSTETYTQLLLPRGFNKVSRYHPTIAVLVDCLCFSHDFEQTHLVIWKMKDFGVHESWIQLFKISYESFFPCYHDYTMDFKRFDLLPLCLSQNCDTLILANDRDNRAFIYKCVDNRVEEIGITNKCFWGRAKDYVESLVSIH